MTRIDDRRLFVAVAEADGFSRAAEALGVPVSTLSRRVAVLEEELGATLFERTTRHTRLTEVGERYLEQLRPLLLGIDDLESGVASGLGSDAGTLRLALPTGLQRPFFTEALSALRAAFPQVVISLVASRPGMHPLRDGVDVVVAEQPPADRDLVAIKLLDTDDVCVAAPAYCARAGRPAAAQALAEHATLVSETTRHVPRWPLVRGGWVPVRPVLRCADYGVLLDGVYDGLGIALLPRLLVWGARPREAEVLLEGVVGQRRRFYLVVQRHARRRPLIGTFIDFAKQFARTVQAESAGWPAR